MSYKPSSFSAFVFWLHIELVLVNWCVLIYCPPLSGDRELLISFRRATGQKPQRIIFYRHFLLFLIFCQVVNKHYFRFV